MALLLYGAGLRLMKCCRLRVQDVDFATDQITIRDGKGGKDRVTMLPVAAKRDLARHIERMRARHARDLAHGAGWVELPWARARKYPDAGREWGWRWVFPATRFDVDRAIGQHRRHHLHESVLQRAVREAVLKAGIVKRQPATPSGIRSRPTCWRTATTSAPFKSLGHRDVSTTMIDTHVLNRGPAAVQSPANRCSRLEPSAADRAATLRRHARYQDGVPAAAATQVRVPAHLSRGRLSYVRPRYTASRAVFTVLRSSRERWTAGRN